jgi:multicomponent K+:H+ antiporter subunit D
VAALFAIMTKVGAYAIIRVYTMIFPPDLEVTAGLQSDWLLVAALVSVALGALGVLAATKLDRLVTFSVIGSMGMVMVTISMFTPASIAAALYYIIHSTLAAAALFLIVDLVKTSRADLSLTPLPPVVGAALVSALFFVSAIAMAGLPPLSGFIGKLLILQAAYSTDALVWVFAIVLIASLVNIVGFARAGSVIFWKAKAVDRPEDDVLPGAPAPLSFVAVGGAIALLVLHTVFAGPMHAYMTTTSQQLFAPEPYIATVLETPGKLSKPKEGDH